MNLWTKLIIGTAASSLARKRLIILTLLIVGTLFFAGTTRVAAKYFKVDYLGSTNANELPTPAKTSP
jgi:hypothetical protein